MEQFWSSRRGVRACSTPKSCPEAPSSKRRANIWADDIAGAAFPTRRARQTSWQKSLLKLIGAATCRSTFQSQTLRTTAIVVAMQTKISQLRAAAAANDWQVALRIAARFPRLGDEGPAITRAHEVLAGRGDFFRQLGRDPDALVAAGIAALRRRYRLP